MLKNATENVTRTAIEIQQQGKLSNRDLVIEFLAYAWMREGSPRRSKQGGRRRRSSEAVKSKKGSGKTEAEREKPGMECIQDLGGTETAHMNH